jgi:hypothetical protein
VLLAQRKFYLLASGTTLTGGTLNPQGSFTEFGTLYLRPTADTLTQERSVLGSG